MVRGTDGSLAPLEAALASVRQAMPIVLFVGAAVAVVAALLARPQNRGGAGAAGLAAAFAGVLFVVSRERVWLLMLSSIPAFLVVHQGMSLITSRGNTVPVDSDSNRRALAGLYLPALGERLLRQIADSRERFFGAGALVLRYLLPAALLFSLPLTLFDALHDPAIRQWINVPAPCLQAAKYGLAGAYVYVLILLGHRTYLRDVTVGAAMWASVTLALGPLLAGVLATFFQSKDQAELSGNAVYFFAGFSPRFVAETAVEMIRRTWFSRNGASEPVRAPVTRVRGVDERVAERLAEEGISDEASLATAEPLRLIRNTAFHKRQIVSFIDNAILHTALPRHWEALEGAGVRGALDLAALASDRGGTAEERERAFESLAKATELADTEVLRRVARSLHEDAQVTLLLLLYTLEDGVVEPERGGSLVPARDAPSP